MNLIDSLKWRTATKVFDTTKKVSPEDVQALIEAANLAPTSGGMQPFNLIVLNNQDIQDNLVEDTYNQTQVSQASHVLIFAIENDLSGIVNRYVNRAAEVRGMKVEDLQGYADSMNYYIGAMDENTQASWAKSQAFISLGMVMAAAADLKIDACPMEGFVPGNYAEKLGLTEKGMTPVVVLPIGYRSEEDKYANMPKVRKDQKDFLIEIN
jgi:nitroreductase